MAMTAIGNFVVAWEHDGDNAGEFHVHFRGCNADGTENDFLGPSRIVGRTCPETGPTGQ